MRTFPPCGFRGLRPRPPRTPDGATHRTLAATDDMASLLRFFLLDTAVPMLKGKRPRRENADHSTDWNTRGRQTPEEGIKILQQYRRWVFVSVTTECSRRQQAEHGAQRHSRRTSGASRAVFCSPLQTEAARKEPGTIKGWQPACLTHRPHRCGMGKNRINTKAHYMGCILKRSRCGHTSP